MNDFTRHDIQRIAISAFGALALSTMTVIAASAPARTAATTPSDRAGVQQAGIAARAI